MNSSKESLGNMSGDQEGMLLYFSPFYKSQLAQRPKDTKPHVPKLDLENLKSPHDSKTLLKKPKSKIIKKKHIKHKFADRVKHLINPRVNRHKRRDQLKSELPNFNEMVSLQSMVNPNKKPIRHLSSKINMMHKRSKRRLFRHVQKSPLEIGNQNEEIRASQPMNLDHTTYLDEDENFRTFAPDFEEQKSQEIPQAESAQVRISLALSFYLLKATFF